MTGYSRRRKRLPSSVGLTKSRSRPTSTELSSTWPVQPVLGDLAPPGDELRVSPVAVATIGTGVRGADETLPAEATCAGAAVIVGVAVDTGASTTVPAGIVVGVAIDVAVGKGCDGRGGAGDGVGVDVGA